ncbi:MAG: alkaline phosphatase family protein [Micropepsaceae bacterium]
MTTTQELLDTFDHVVVLMMENRSFDNLLGHLYDAGLPAGKKFEGAQGQWNPDHNGKGRIETSLTSDPHEPFPDPGEFFKDVITQLYGTTYVPNCTSSDPTSGEPTMNGFVLDYYNVLRDLTENKNPYWRWPFDPGFHSKKIMKCFEPGAIPALATLAKDFAVFDHWFCALPSETWPNRAFWHAATSWGFADMPLHVFDCEWNLWRWIKRSHTGTLFSLLDDKFGADADNWCIYSDMPISATELIHLGSFHNPFKKAKVIQRHLQYDVPTGPNFFTDCASGKLPKYSFLEPHMFNFMPPEYWHNDMHPSEWMHAWHWMFLAQGGPGSVLLGDHLIWQVYEALRSSPQRDRTLFIITFDEHGGCFDHVRPPTATAPTLSDRQYGFPFERLGVRVPMVMISSFIAENTIVNDPMHHCSFLKTMQKKWDLGSLGPRQDDAPCFADAVFSIKSGSGLLNESRSWPDLSHIYRDHPAIARAKAKPPKLKRDQPLSRLQSLIVASTYVHLCNLGHASHDERPKMATQGDAHDFFERFAEPLNKIRRGG